MNQPAYASSVNFSGWSCGCFIESVSGIINDSDQDETLFGAGTENIVFAVTVNLPPLCVLPSRRLMKLRRDPKRVIMHKGKQPQYRAQEVTKGVSPAS
ncbi:hypothetical protein BaRGS_00023030 [Batillaria attramentaria]|uniref:Uncharacterized protein n=1 Tax=Batillaria attramentaria TaxID=370345 RepID=A0ABD0KF42_9CAEN